jgi:hypothetical protein
VFTVRHNLRLIISSLLPTPFKCMSTIHFESVFSTYNDRSWIPFLVCELFCFDCTNELPRPAKCQWEYCRVLSFAMMVDRLGRASVNELVLGDLP